MSILSVANRTDDDDVDGGLEPHRRYSAVIVVTVKGDDGTGGCVRRPDIGHSIT